MILVHGSLSIFFGECELKSCTVFLNKSFIHKDFSVCSLETGFASAVKT